VVARVGAIIVTYHDLRWLTAAVEALDRSSYEDLYLYVVDNGANARTEVADTAHPLRIASPSGNLGFAAGANLGIFLAMNDGCQYLVLINPDTRAPRELIGRLVDCLERRPELGVIGPLQMKYGTVTADYSHTAGELNDWTRRMLGSSSVEYMGTWVRRLRRSALPPIATDEIFECSYVQGAAMAFHRRTFQEVGVFDQAYHTYHEEVDFCRRVRWTGLRVGLMTTSFIEHAGRDVGDRDLWRRYLRTRSRYYYLATEPNLRAWERKAVFLRWLTRDLVAALCHSFMGDLTRARALLLARGWFGRNGQHVRQTLQERRRAFRRGAKDARRLSPG
jgi:GT2 family glycosyltransferase